MHNACLSFCHFNIRSVCTGFDLFSEMISKENFTVIGLSETWLDDRTPDYAIQINDYKLIRNDRQDRGGGVAFYIKKDIKYKILEAPNSGPIEQLWLSTKVGGKSLCLGTLYRPPNTNLMLVIDNLETILENFLPEFDYVLFGGDFNVDLLNENNSGYLQFTNFLNKYGLCQIIEQPTRVTDNTQTLLDLIISSSSDIVAGNEVFKMDDISDHHLVTSYLKIKKTKQPPIFRTYRDFSDFNIDIFLRDLRLINFDYIYTLNNVDEMVNFWNTSIIWLFNIHAPLKTARITKLPAPWLTENIKIMIKLRDKALLKYKRSKSETDWLAYKTLRNLVNMSIKSEKKAYLHYQFKKDPKTFWNSLKYLNVHSDVQKPVLDFGKPDEFNDFFVNKVPQAKIDKNFITDHYVNKRFPGFTHEFNFVQISVKKMESILNTIKSNARGSDDIDLRMLNIVIPHLSHHLTFIINQCLITGTFPNAWKEANVIPVPKNQNPSSVSEFRPISILPTISKILEKIIHEQITFFLEQNNILPLTQSGFRKNHSTTTALLQVTDELFRAGDNNKNSCLTLLDYSKAFDTLDHLTLCIKLRYFGLSNTSINFFSNYLCNRRQRVVINGNLSNVLNISKGVPQGSVLGPLLFAVYTADFSKYLQYSDSHQYADDFQMYFNFLLNDTAVEYINHDLLIISRVSKAHGLILNNAKTKLLVFGKHKDRITNNSLFEIKLDGETLAFSDCAKNLGLYIDTNLRFQKHVKSIMQKSYSKLKVLYIHKDILKTDVKLMLCDSLILSYVTYCDTVYWPAITNKDKESLQRLQNACLRFSYNLRKFDHISSKFKHSNWLNLDERYRVHMACLTYKINLSKSPGYLYDKLKKGSTVHQRITRYNDHYIVPKHSTALFQRSFSYNAVKIYNKLPPTIKYASSIISFRRQIKTSLLSNRTN